MATGSVIIMSLLPILRRPAKSLAAAAVAASLVVSTPASAQEACNDPSINQTINNMNFWAFIATIIGRSDIADTLNSQANYLDACCISGADDCLCDSPDVASAYTDDCS